MSNNKADKNKEGWPEKVQCFESFVRDTLGSIIDQIEGSSEFTNLKQTMHSHLEKLKKKIANGEQISSELFHHNIDSEVIHARPQSIANTSPHAVSTPKPEKRPDGDIGSNDLAGQVSCNSPIIDKVHKLTDTIHISSSEYFVPDHTEQCVMTNTCESEVPRESEKERALSADIENLEADRKAQIAKKNKEINHLNGRVEKLKEEKSKLSTEIAEKEKERKCLEAKVKAQKQELQSGKQEIKTLKEHQTVLQTTIDQQAGTISSQKLVIHEQEIALESHFNLATSFME